MSGSTTNEGYPYPLTSDFADVQDAFRLASAIDSDVRAGQAPMRTFLARPSFIARQTVASSTTLAGTLSMTYGAIDWDNTGGVAVGGSTWSQPYAQGPSWWLFGGTLLVAASGSPVVGEMNMGEISVTTVDQVTGVSSSTITYQRNDESNTNGEWINIYAMAPIYKGSAGMYLTLNSSTQKGIQVGSRFWGMYLGPVT